MIPVAEARARIVAALPGMPAETVSLAHASGRVLAEPLTARRTQPPFPVSAMDGWAVRHADLSDGCRLAPIGSVAAGGRFDGRVGQGEAVRIFTGAPVPEGADTILIQEDALIAPDGAVQVKEIPKPGQWVRKAGLDFAEGDDLLEAGLLLTPADVALAAAMNRPWLQVRRRPRVAILATGDELALPGDPIGPNQIVSSNNFGIAAMVVAAGGEAVDLGIARDTPEHLQEKAAPAASCDLLITLGGASVGDHDLIHRVLGAAGGSIDFWRIAMRPGKPLMFGNARLGGQASVPLLGLPGNPVSAMVCGHLFLVPAIRAMLGLGWQITPAQARAGSDLAANDQREDYLRAKLTAGNDGTLTATPFSRQDSSMLRLFSAADCLILRPPHAPALAAGEPVPIIRLRP